MPPLFFLLLSTLAFNSLVVVKGETNEVGFIIKMSVTYYNNGTENWPLLMSVVEKPFQSKETDVFGDGKAACTIVVTIAVCFVAQKC